MDRRRAREDAVVIARKILRHAQSLASARRAAVPVRVGRRLSVVRLDELLAENRHQVLRPIGEVDLQRNVGLAGVAGAVAHAVIDATERAAAADVARVRRRAGITARDDRGRSGNRSRVTAAAQ